MVILLTIIVIYLFVIQRKVIKTVGEEPVTDTMLFSEGMSWVTPVPIPDSLFFSSEKVPLDLFYVREQLDRELTVNTYWHSSTILLLKRAARWLPVIEPVLHKYGIPDDFKYLPIIESGLLNVVSPSGAAGYWQFLENTGKEYGLTINKEIDERYHVTKATEAACKYFLKSFGKMGNWTLVAASYNAGQKRVLENIARQHTRNYYEMYLSDETSRYIFRLLAIKLIHENPEKYGFKVLKGDLYDPLKLKTVDIKNTISSLPDFALKNKISYRMLKELNPWLISDKLSVKHGNVFTIALPSE